MSAPGPLISVIIPSCGRIESLKKCAAGLAGQTFDRSQFEVIIVNDGSSANFSPVVDAATKIDLKIITQNQAGPASARNRGAAEARGQLLAFTDDDCVPDANWLSAIAARAVGRPGCLIGGQTFNALPNDPYSSASHALIEYFYAHLNQDPNNAVSFPSNNIAMPAENFRAMGGFDTTYPFAAAEDRDFCQRWLDHKFTMIFAPEMLIHHAHPMTLRSYWRQHFRYGSGAYRFHKSRAKQKQIHKDFERGSFYRDLLLSPWKAGSGCRAMQMTTLLVISQIANTSGFFTEAADDRFGRAKK
jgi:glycosyltransferase involved in cell wall biosynthesis